VSAVVVSTPPPSLARAPMARVATLLGREVFVEIDQNGL